MYIYRTNFTLTSEVNDFEAARDYLKDDEMLWYLDDGKTKDKLKSIDWILVDNQSGYIEVVSKELLDEEDLDCLEEYISGQNSDGLGEGFEQQDFAETYCIPEEEWEDDEDYSDFYYCASFNWRNEKYRLTLIERSVKYINV